MEQMTAPCLAPCPTLQRGQKVICQASFDGEQHVAQVVELRSRQEDGSAECFVHFEDCDKRCDEWVRTECVMEYSEAVATELARRRPAVATEFGADTVRRRKRRFDSISSQVDGETGKGHCDAHSTLKPRFVETIAYGCTEIRAWYQSPLPPPYCTLSCLFICPFTLKYFRKWRRCVAFTQAIAVEARHPPGARIYRSPEPPAAAAAAAGGPGGPPGRTIITAATDPRVSMYEVDGAKQKLFCQNLCLLAKFFLEGKTLVWEVHEFMFYVLCEESPEGEEIVGYYSREKRNENNHLACILTLPHRQNKGYGGLLIDFSYEMAKRSGKPGCPERPLSDLGERAFLEYWERTLVGKLLLLLSRGPVVVSELAAHTGIHKNDIIEVLGPNSRLAELKLLQWVRDEYFVDLKSVDVVQELHTVLTEGKRRLVVDPGCFSQT